MNVPDGRQTPHSRERQHPLTWLALAVPLLFGCSQNASVPNAADPYANGVSYPWEYQAPADKLGSLSLTPGENNLYFEPILAASNSWGPIEIDHSNGEQKAGDGKTITLSGKTYSRGFGVHAHSELRFSLKGTNGAVCTRFTSDIGVDAEVGSKGSVVFQVFLDGVKKYDSGTMIGSSATKQIDLDVSGKTELRLVVTDAGNGISYDHADWASPKVYCQAPNASGSPDKSFGTNGIANVGGVDAVLEPDGSIVYALSNFFGLTRRLPSGDRLTTTLSLGSQDSASALIRQPDGKLVLVGTSDNRFATVRFNADLSLDTSFGNGGIVITAIPTIGLEAAYAVARQSDGRLIVGGTVRQEKSLAGQEFASQDMALVRYTANGRVDPSFGSNGIAIVGLDGDSDSSYSDDAVRSFVIQPDGKLVIAVKYDVSGQGNFWELVRLTSNGSMDEAFNANLGIGNYAIHDRGDCMKITLLPNKEIVAIGTSERYVRPATIQKIASNGLPLGTKKINIANTTTPDTYNQFSDLIVQPDGTLLLSGMGYGNKFLGNDDYAPVKKQVLIRLKPDLTLDSTFGTGGEIETSLSGKLLQQPDGKFLVYNTTQTARYFP